MSAPNSIVIRITGHPKPNPRVRARAVQPKGGGKPFATTYPSGSDAAWRQRITMAAMPLRPVQMIEGPVRVDTIFILPRPKNHLSTGKQGGLKKSAPKFWHTIGRGIYGGDRDNFEKSLLDTLTECGYWKDDGQACAGQPLKRWAYPGEATGALVVVTPLEDKEPTGWLADLDRKMRLQAKNAPAPKTQQVIHATPAPPKPKSEYRKFTDLWMAKWMGKHMGRYPFGETETDRSKTGKAAMRIWDACGHDLGKAERVIDAFLADDQEFYQGHTLQMLSAGGVLPKFLARANQFAVKPPARLTEMEMYGTPTKRK